METHVTNKKGKHWEQKVKEGRPPEPWKGCTEWAEKNFIVKNKFAKLLEDKKIQYKLPWENEIYNIRCGNRTKVHYMELIIHYINNTATFTFFDTQSKGFFGIRGIFVSKEQRLLFDQNYN